MVSCAPKGDIESWKQEVADTELQFSAMADSLGTQAAFEAFAAEDAVLMRNNTIIKGRKSIADLFKNSDPNAKLSWGPDFVDVSASGDLAYTYGTYVYSTTDSTGVERNSEGIFHTVWKRQADGSWKYVWD